ncbi:MAG: tetratricopeptide repeat protein [Bacteroidia bacterium]
MTLTRILIICSVLLGLTACSSQKKVSTEKVVTGGELTEKEQLEFAYLFHDAEKDKLLGNFSLAQDKFQQAIRINPRSSAAHFELSQIYLQTGNIESAEISGKQAVRFDGKNKWYKMALADIYEQVGKYNEIIPLIEQLRKQEPFNPDYIFGLGAAQAQVGDYAAAVKTYDDLEEITGLTEELALQKKNLYMKMGKTDKALEEIRKLMKMYPEEAGYHGFLAEIYEATDQPDKALEEYKEILRKEPDNANVHFSLAEYYRQQGNKDKSFEELKLAFANPESSLELKLQVLASYFDITAQYPSLKTQAMELCTTLIEAHPEESRARAVYGDFLIRDNQLENALEQYKIILETDKSSYNVWNQVLLIEAELQHFQSLFDLSKEAMELFPYQPNIFLYNGIAAIQLKNYDEAISALKDGANVTIGNSELSSQFYSSIGDSYNYLSKYKESNEAYEKALKYDESNTYVLNNYAYYLSLRKENLQRAKEMAEKCNILQPGNPSFLDTFAWVLFQMGEFEDANKWIDTAIDAGGIKSGTIMEHKGDILFKLGKTSDALDFWIRANELGQGSEKLSEKIKQKKYID